MQKVENLYDVSKMFNTNLTDNRPVKATFHCIEGEVLKYSLEIAGLQIPLETKISIPYRIAEDFSLEEYLEEYRENYIRKYNPRNEEDFLQLEMACHFEREDIEIYMERPAYVTVEERIMQTTFKLMMVDKVIRLSEIYYCMRAQLGEEFAYYDFCSCGGIYQPVWDNAPDLASFCSMSGQDCPDKRNRSSND